MPSSVQKFSQVMTEPRTQDHDASLLVCPNDLLGFLGEGSSKVKLLGLESESEEGWLNERMPRKKLP